MPGWQVKRHTEFSLVDSGIQCLQVLPTILKVMDKHLQFLLETKTQLYNQKVKSVLLAIYHSVYWQSILPSDPVYERVASLKRRVDPLLSSSLTSEEGTYISKCSPLTIVLCLCDLSLYHSRSSEATIPPTSFNGFYY